MSPASHMVCRLRKLYGNVLKNVAFSRPRPAPRGRKASFELHALEPRLLLTVSPAPGMHDLLAACDSGISSTDNVTNFDNSEPAKALSFSVPGTVPGALIEIYDSWDYTLLGSAVATGTTTILTLAGDHDMADGRRVLYTVQTVPGMEGAEGWDLPVTIDTTPPTPRDYQVDTNFDATGAGSQLLTTVYDGFVDSVGRFVLVGSKDAWGETKAAIARLNPDGSPDTTFGTGGVMTILVIESGPDEFRTAARTADDAIIVGGSATGGQKGFLARCDQYGRLDTNFGTSGYGIVLTDGFAVVDLVTQSDGKIIAMGETDGDPVNTQWLARYTSSGLLDTTFDGDGKAAVPSLSSAMAIQPDDKVVVALGSPFGACRYNTNGSRDTTFGPSGIRSGAVTGLAAHVAVSGGKILLAGCNNNGDPVLVRYNANGTLDTTFDGDGIVVTPRIGTGEAEFNARVAVQTDGTILAAVQSSGLQLRRYNADGSLDGSGGGISEPAIYSAVFPPDGKVLILMGQGYTRFRPLSGVMALGAASPTRFRVAWTSEEPQPGPYNIYVCREDGAERLWLAHTRLTEAVYTGLPGHTYRFYALCEDVAGNIQARPLSFDAWTTVKTAPTLTAVRPLSGGTVNAGCLVTYNMLAAAANEADLDGDRIGFHVVSVSSGQVSDTELWPGGSIWWTAPAGKTGILNAFKVKATDGERLSATAVQVKVTMGIPDLSMASAGSTVWQSAAVGSPVEWRATVKNVGAFPQRADFRVAWYLSTDKYYQSTDKLVGAETYSDDIYPGHSQAVTMIANVPSVTRGQKYVIARVRNLGLDALSTNNTRTGSADWFGAVAGDPYDPFEGESFVPLRAVAGSNAWQGLTLNTPWAVDRYGFMLSEASAYGGPLDRVWISFATVEGDLSLRLLDCDGNEVARSEGSGDSEAISLNGLISCYYYVEIFSAYGDVSPRYNLGIHVPA